MVPEKRPRGQKEQEEQSNPAERRPHTKTKQLQCDKQWDSRNRFCGKCPIQLLLAVARPAPREDYVTGPAIETTDGWRLRRRANNLPLKKPQMPTVQGTSGGTSDRQCFPHVGGGLTCQVFGIALSKCLLGGMQISFRKKETCNANRLTKCIYSYYNNYNYSFRN